MAGKPGRRGFGRVRQMPTPTGRRGRWQAFYNDPTGLTRLSRTGKPTPVRHRAPHTFDTKQDAEAWLVDERRLISAGTWTPPAVRASARETQDAAETMTTFSEYAKIWIGERRVKGRPLATNTRDHYEDLLRLYLEPAFGAVPIDQITPEAVTAWYETWKPTSYQGKKGRGETARAHSYGFARAVLNTAVAANGPMPGHVNPFAVRGGGSSPTRKRDELATAAEVQTMLATIRPEWAAMVQLGLWTGLRYGEIVGLRRRDIDLDRKVVVLEEAIARTRSEGTIRKDPKSAAGVRRQRIPANLTKTLKHHLADHTGRSRDALLFPSPGDPTKPVSPSTFYGTDTRPGTWYAARKAADHPTLHFHDLRATGATLLAQQGATEAEIMAFLGDATPQAAQRYVRAARSRMDDLTKRLGKVAKKGGW